MAKLTKSERKAHEQACELLKNDHLSTDEKIFVLQNWHEGATHMNGSAGAHFTPWALGRDFGVDVGGGHKRVLDLCAGIGGLSYWLHESVTDLVCVEINPAYVEVGQKILPQATWICADVLDMDLSALGYFDLVVSNPPFGSSSSRSARAPRYSGSAFELHVMDLASGLAAAGAFVVPQASASFRLSGVRCFRQQSTDDVTQFTTQTGIHMEPGCGIDTAVHLTDWRDVKPMCEIVHCEFAEVQQARAEALVVRAVQPLAQASVSLDMEQAEMF